MSTFGVSVFLFALAFSASHGYPRPDPGTIGRCSEVIPECMDAFQKKMMQPNFTAMCGHINSMLRCIGESNCMLGEADAMVQMMKQQLESAGLKCDLIQLPLKPSPSPVYPHTNWTGPYPSPVYPHTNWTGPHTNWTGPHTNWTGPIHSTYPPYNWTGPIHSTYPPNNWTGHWDRSHHANFTTYNSTNTVFPSVVPYGANPMATLMNVSYLNPFIKWVNTSTELNQVQIKLAVEQTQVAKLMRKKLNLEIRSMKKQKFSKKKKN